MTGDLFCFNSFRLEKEFFFVLQFKISPRTAFYGLQFMISKILRLMQFRVFVCFAFIHSYVLFPPFRLFCKFLSSFSSVNWKTCCERKDANVILALWGFCLRHPLTNNSFFSTEKKSCTREKEQDVLILLFKLIHKYRREFELKDSRVVD